MKVPDQNVTGTGKTIRKEILIPVIFSIVILFYSYIIGTLLWGLIAVLQIAILWVLIYRTFRNIKEKHYDHSKRPTGTTIIVILYAMTLMIFSIVILFYSYIIGMLLWGLIAVLQIAILWVLIYRAFRNKKEKHYDHGKRPVGITLIAILYAITVFLEISRLVSRQPVMVFGGTYSTILGQLVHVIFILIGIYLTYGFIKLLRFAWIIAIIFEFYGLANKSIYLISISSYMGYWITFPIFGLLLNMIVLVYIFGAADYFRK